jgi:hypothetical protein
MLNRNLSARTAAQKWFKCSLLQRPAIILAMLLLCAVLSAEAQTTLKSDSGFLSTGSISFRNDMPKKDTTKWKDTVAVTLLVCDTSNIRSNVYWLNAYSIRNAEYELVDVSVNPNTSTYVGGGFYSTTLLGWSPVWKNKPVFSHLQYIDDKKLPLSKSVIVLQSVSK